MPKSNVPLTLALRYSLYERGHVAAERETIIAIADALDHLIEGCRKHPDEMSLESLADLIQAQSKALRELDSNPLAEEVAPDYKAVLRKYKAHEQSNEHSEAALLLAQTFGTETEIAGARELLAEGDRLGHAPTAASEFQYQMSRKYYRDLVSKANAT